MQTLQASIGVLDETASSTAYLLSLGLNIFQLHLGADESQLGSTGRQLGKTSGFRLRPCPNFGIACLLRCPTAKNIKLSQSTAVIHKPRATADAGRERDGRKRTAGMVRSVDQQAPKRNTRD